MRENGALAVGDGGLDVKRVIRSEFLALRVIIIQKVYGVTGNDRITQESPERKERTEDLGNTNIKGQAEEKEATAVSVECYGNYLCSMGREDPSDLAVKSPLAPSPEHFYLSGSGKRQTLKIGCGAHETKGAIFVGDSGRETA